MEMIMIDCTILSFKNVNYILPTLAITQAIILPDNVALKRNTKLVGHYFGQDQDKPIVTLDMLPLGDAALRHPKIAVLRCMPPLSADFCVLFTEQAKRLRISHDNITWASEDKNQAIITEKKVQIEVSLVNIAELSIYVNQLMDTSTQVAK